MLKAHLMSRDVAFPGLYDSRWATRAEQVQLLSANTVRLPWDLLFKGKIWLLGRLGIIR